ncbi:conserved hypothetical protein [Talaromyces stipitatus ATCC 10500]|uniref:DNA-directed RNA polymerase I 49 kDa polypeptide n=1 Tax=Talaromyces stipitatus (strain ATCC 10500 / CBS 375.48 / QM 6759 / NRRL 1006) TaxID=441959 RepID=B8MBU3_TALSN|nr:uncharacterized protein TSTA_119810 [Talaromyces stipitatus ATCC 10500]EED18226.1 conserved hypothetical protein [Talaromyces stipitatus ATCC 10500]
MASDKVEKKRKRDSDRHDRPSKKPAIEAQNLPPLTASVLKDDNELAPVLINAPGLQFPKKVHGFKPYTKESSTSSKTASSSGRNKGIVSTELLLQSSEHPKLDFVGTEATEDADSQLKHYIAIVDPEKKTWQFVEVRKMTLRSTVKKRNPSVAADEDDSDGADVSYRDQRNALTEAFGTKASRKAAQSEAENSMLAPAGGSSAIESAILSSMPLQGIATANLKAQELQAQVQANKPIPTANLSAMHPSEVYTIESLVAGGMSTLNQLPIQEWQDAVNAGEAVMSTSRYVAHRVDAVVKSTNVTHLQLLRYILALIELTKNIKRGKGSDPPGSKRIPLRADLKRLLSGGSSATTQLPEPVVEAIRRKFAPGGIMIRSNITLLYTTLCALTLHIPPTPTKDGGTSSLGGNTPTELATDPSDLRDDLRLDTATITQYFKELGCRVEKPRESEFAKFGIKSKAEAANKRVCKLRIPLDFPKVSRGGGPRR